MSDESEKREIDRNARRKARAMLKRSGLIASIRSIHKLSTRISDEPSLIPEFLVNVDTLDDLWAQFEAEDNTVLDCVVNLNMTKEYSTDLHSELRGVINATKAVALTHRPMGQDGKRGFSLSSGGSDAPIGRVFSRLPDIPLPIFKGDCHLWPSFRDSFTALVDDRPGLSNIDKFYYLMGCLQGPALDAISGISASGDNYQLAWSTLCTRFYRPRMVATSLIDRLLNAPASSQESLPELMTFLVTFDESISLLSALNIPDLGSFMLFSLAFRSLPLATRKLFESTVANNSDYPSIDNLLTFVRTRVTVLENAGDSRKTVAPQKALPEAGPSVKNRFGKGSPVALVAAKSSSTSTTSCPCCAGGHTLSSCTQFQSWSLEDRNRWAHDHKLCFNCLASSHWLRACKSKARCNTCSRRHHSLLHGATPSSTGDDGEKTEDAVVCAAALSPRPNSVSTVLLGTALIHARDRVGTWQTVRALVDSASQISAITVACSDRLGLRPRPCTMPVSGLAGTPVVDVKGFVDCDIRPRFAAEPVLAVRAWILPSITGDMPRTSFSSSSNSS